MSEPAVFVVIRDQQRRYFYDRWANVFLYRNLIWGPDDLDEWLETEEAYDEWDGEVCGVAVIDHDRRQLVWDGDPDELNVPRVVNVLHELMQTSWRGYEVQIAARGATDVAIVAGVHGGDVGLIEEADPIADRAETVREAAGIYDHDGDDDLDDVEGDEFDEDTPRAWVTLINEEGVVRHRHLNEISQDLLKGKKDAFHQLIALNSGDVPAEAVVTEGIWFDFGRKEIGYWGCLSGRSAYAQLRRGWSGWKVDWADGGYSDQCQVSGPSGIPMSDAEALASLTPQILSTKRIDLESVMGMLGGQVKKVAVRATGCVTVVLCIPVLLFGLIAGKMQAALITILIVVVAVALVFKLIERKFKRKFNESPIGLHAKGKDDEGLRAPVAGPLDPAERRDRLERLLAAAGMPALSEIEKHIDSDDAMKELL
ncbi:hypothetical protein [Aporhodopirellula aestuarii]|uniref:Uncharacterized protein n=1 Tax=Aporhodopirellula aestuarii TaxID=2950107 RepID=A0ABT0U4P9_9BACT|nr:hypothetical protein [Aporhodopirellula aestuarii]MCM2371792.1 hypothetical protein [Aporhodopirellula aestuarii]